MSKKVRIGFVGVGGMGQMAHLSNYAVLKEECEVVALAEPRKGMAELVATRYGIPRTFADHRELLEWGEVDAVVAAQPYRRHAIIVPDILRAGVPVLTEKPLCLTVEEGEKLVQLGEEKGVLHVVGNHKRSDPAMAYAKGVIDDWKASGKFGRMTYIRASMPPGDWIHGMDMPLGTDEPYPTNIEFETMPRDMDETAGRKYDEFVNYYIHQVNALHFLLGEPYKLTYADPSGVLFVGESASGVCVILEMAPYSTSIEWHESFKVCFEKGFVNVELPAPLVRQEAGKVTVMEDLGDGTPRYWQPVMPNRSAMRQQAINYLSAVRGEKPAPCAAKDALEDLRIARQYIKLRYGQ